MNFDQAIVGMCKFCIFVIVGGLTVALVLTIVASIYVAIMELFNRGEQKLKKIIREEITNKKRGRK